MRAQVTTIAALWLTALAGSAAVRAGDGPLFGGTPIVERVDEFGGGEFDFLVTVHTAVYYGPDAVLPDALVLVELNEGESYLIYLVHNQGETAVDLFGLLNPDSITIPAAGILPADIVQDESFDPDDLVYPSVWFFGIDLISFTWDESFGLLGPGNWSIVFYRSQGWQDVTGWVGDSSDSGDLDLDLLLGPSEEVDLPEEPNNCPADVNGDGVVDVLDLGAVSACLGQEVEEGDPCFPADVNGDGVVDVLDLGFVTARFGECPVSDCADNPDDCEDGVDCTDDVCQDGTCVYPPNDANCADDGLFCNGSEECDAVEGCVSTGNPCDEDMFCNEDTDTCVECAQDSDCDDDDACTLDSCDPATGCVGDPIDCDDSDACTTDGCDPATGCTNDPVDCDDDDACTLDGCDPATGCVSDPIDCDDGNSCTADGCNPANGLCLNERITPCCGNTVCDLGEDSCVCPIDCGEPPVVETDCADGVDEDCDESTDCDDVDCALDPICICVVDGECSDDEDCVNCPDDCFSGGGTCGDGICEGNGEDCLTCTVDCPCPPTPDCSSCCGDGVCTPVLETVATCPVDCDPTFEPPTSCCGDGSCEGTENAVNCTVDCAG